MSNTSQVRGQRNYIELPCALHPVLRQSARNAWLCDLLHFIVINQLTRMTQALMLIPTFRYSIDRGFTLVKTKCKSSGVTEFRSGRARRDKLR